MNTCDYESTIWRCHLPIYLHGCRL